MLFRFGHLHLPFFKVITLEEQYESGSLYGERLFRFISSSFLLLLLLLFLSVCCPCIQWLARVIMVVVVVVVESR